jgi:hypothetical protein
MIFDLAQQVILDRLDRCVVVGINSKGDAICEMLGEPSEAERQWTTLQATFERPDGPERPRWCRS